jgi:hypothetical protein
MKRQRALHNLVTMNSPNELMRTAILKVVFFAATLSVNSAFAACPAANQYNFLFSSQAATTLAYGSTYTYTASTSGGATQNFTVGFTQNGLTSTTVGGEVRPNLSTSHNGGTAAVSLVVGGVLPGRTADITTGTRVMVTTFTFPFPCATSHSRCTTSISAPTSSATG